MLPITQPEPLCLLLKLDKKSLILEGCVNGIPFSMIVDTGSSLSLLSESTATKLSNISIRPCSVPIVRLANGHSMVPIGHCRAMVSFEGTDTLHEFFVYNSLPFEILLGLDFCEKTKMKIDFEKIKNNPKLDVIEEFPLRRFEFLEKPKNKFRIVEDQLIPSRTGIWCELVSEIELSETILFIFSRIYEFKSRTLLNDCLLRPEKKCVWVFIINPNHYNVLIRGGTCVGSFKEIKFESEEPLKAIRGQGPESDLLPVSMDDEKVLPSSPELFCKGVPEIETCRYNLLRLRGSYCKRMSWTVPDRQW